jgi:hypothetical protein
MAEPRWTRRAGSGIAAISALVILTSTTSGARERAWEPPPCAGQPVPAAVPATGTTGTWYRADPALRDGALVGMRVAVGDGGSSRPRLLELDPESFVAGPFSNILLVGSDDGSASTLHLIDVTRACAWPVASSDAVIRRATLAPDGSAIVESRVERATRADLGVFLRPLDGSNGERRLLAPIPADARFGPTWSTELLWSTDGASLAVQSCGERACRTRILDMGSGAVRTIDDPGLADMVGLADGRLVVHAACGGLPCPLVAVSVDDGRQVILDDTAGQAVLAMDADGAPVVVHEVDADGTGLRRVGLDGTRGALLTGDPDGRRLVAGPGRSSSGADVPAGSVLFAPGGRPPLDGRLDAVLRRLADGDVTPLKESSR